MPYVSDKDSRWVKPAKTAHQHGVLTAAHAQRGSLRRVWRFREAGHAWSSLVLALGTAAARLGRRRAGGARAEQRRAEPSRAE